MSGRVAVWLAWSSLALSVSLLAATYVLARLSSTVPDRPPLILLSLTLLPFAAVGALVASRRPENAIGWIFCGIGVAGELQAFAFAYATYAVLTAPGSLPIVRPLLWLLNVWGVLFGLIMLAFLLFPTGHPPSRRWRPVLWLIPLFVALVLLSGEADPRLAPAPLVDLFGVEIGTRLRGAIQSVSGPMSAGLFAPAAAAMVVRFRRARGEERQQLKWFAYATVLFAVVNLANAFAFFTPSLRTLDPSAANPSTMFKGIPIMVAFLAIPAAAGLAILRYRLYDIDLLINKTLVYGATSVALGVSFVVALLTLQALLRPVTGGSDLAVAGSTLLLFTLFRPVRDRVQAAVDRRFYRSRYDAARAVDAFTARLRNEVDIDSVRTDLLEAVGDSVRPAHASLWLRGTSR